MKTNRIKKINLKFWVICPTCKKKHQVSYTENLSTFFSQTEEERRKLSLLLLICEECRAKVNAYSEDWVKAQIVSGHKSQYQIEEENQSKEAES